MNMNNVIDGTELRSLFLHESFQMIGASGGFIPLKINPIARILSLNSESCVTVEHAIDFVNRQLVKHQEQPLGIAEILLLKGIWDKKNYRAIALEGSYSPDYFINVAAPKLLQKISNLLGYRVTKKSCRMVLAKHIAKNQKTQG